MNREKSVLGRRSTKIKKKMVYKSLKVGETEDVQVKLVYGVKFTFVYSSSMYLGLPHASLYVECVGYSEGCVTPACVDSQEA